MTSIPSRLLRSVVAPQASGSGRGSRQRGITPAGTSPVPQRGWSAGGAAAGHPGGDLGAGADSEPEADPLDMSLGGPLLDAQPPGDLPVGQSLGDECSDLQLPWRQLVRVPVRGPRWG